jgi:hypothetical protein
MDDEKALVILRALSNGTDPFTGETFPATSPYQHPEMVRALFQAVHALESATAGKKRQAARAATGKVSNSGKPWTKEEDDRLLATFDAGKSVDELAAEHGRSRLAIEARLAKFGKVPTPTGLRIAAVQAREPVRFQYTVPGREFQ